jgi:hypothetical protein
MAAAKPSGTMGDIRRMEPGSRPGWNSLPQMMLELAVARQLNKVLFEAASLLSSRAKPRDLIFTAKCTKDSVPKI